MGPISLPLGIAIFLLIIDSILEMAFITSMVAWLNAHAGYTFIFDNDSSFFLLEAQPLHFSVDQGHTSNAAAGTALILVGIAGLLALFLRSWICSPPTASSAVTQKAVRVYYALWLLLTLLSALLTLAALIYTFVVTAQTTGQTIDLAAAAVSALQPNPPPYPFGDWTPETWLDAVLRLPLYDPAQVSSLRTHLTVMVGWRWNLVPMFVLGVVVCGLAFADALRSRARERKWAAAGRGSVQLVKNFGPEKVATEM